MENLVSVTQTSAQAEDQGVWDDDSPECFTEILQFRGDVLLKLVLSLSMLVAQHYIQVKSPARSDQSDPTGAVRLYLDEKGGIHPGGAESPSVTTDGLRLWLSSRAHTAVLVFVPAGASIPTDSLNSTLTVSAEFAPQTVFLASYPP